MNKVPKMEFETIEENAEAAAGLLKSMANQHRLLILCRLGDKEYSVGELEEIVGLSQSALSQHLARLRSDGLVETRRKAQTIYYSLCSDEAFVMMKTLCALLQPTDDAAAKVATSIAQI
jgi:DNA-binding transcriptional ArsR family regulator